MACFNVRRVAVILLVQASRVRADYLRDGVRCFLDRSRGYLVQATPEEHVRQDALDWLLDDLKIPAGLVRSEFPTARRGGTGRADILVLAPGSTDYDGKTVLVVECKREGAFLDDKTRDQATSYAKSVNAGYVVLTNGTERVAFARDKGRWRKLGAVPSWREMLKQQGLRWAAEPRYDRAAWSDIDTTSKCRALIDRGAPFEWIVGEDTPDHVVPIALNLFGCLAFEPDVPLPIDDDSITIVKDLGVRRRWFGNSAGGTWPSDYYRSFLVHEKQTGFFQVVSLVVMAGAKRVNDPTFGNVRGQTYLIVSVDDGTNSHNSLQLSLDKFVREDEAKIGRVTFRHDGTMTAGKAGRVANDKVVSFARRIAPQLVEGKAILLGTLPTKRLMVWPDAREFLLRCVRYALVRDQLRRELRAMAAPVAAAPVWEHGAIVKARYDGEVHEPARFIRLKSKSWAWLHWYDDTFSPVRLKDIIGRSSRPWKLAEVAADVDLSDLQFV